MSGNNNNNQNPEQLFMDVFQRTLDDSKPIRENAEAQLLDMAQYQPTMCLEMFRFAVGTPREGYQGGPSNDGTDAHLRLAACTKFKNLLCNSNWERTPYFDNNGKQTIKNQIFPVLCQPYLKSEMLSMLMVCLEHVVMYEWPHKWENLVPNVYEFLNTALDPRYSAETEEAFTRQVNTIKAGCLVLRICAKWTLGTSTHGKPTTNMSMADELSMGALPKFVQVLQLVSKAPVCPVVLQCQVAALKGIKSFLHESIPKVLTNVDAFEQFYSSLIHLTSECGQRLASYYTSTENADQFASHLTTEGILNHTELTPFFSVFKLLWSLHVKMMTNYQVVRDVEKQARGVAKLFLAKFAPQLYQLAIATIQWHDGQVDPETNTKMTSKAYIKSLDFVQLCVFNKELNSVVIEGATELIGKNLVPRLAVTKEDADLWDFDSEEFIRKQMRPELDFWSPKRSCLTVIREFLLFFAQKRTDLLGGFLGQIEERLRVNEDPIETDALLYLLANLPASIKKNFMTSSQLEHVLGQVVAPHLRSDNKFLRAKSILVLSKYCSIQWSSQDVFNSVVNCVLDALDDVELPVRMTAAHLLIKFVRMPESRPVIEPRVLAIVRQYLAIMGQMDSDETIRTLNKIIKRYGESLHQWAVELARTLIQHFVKVQQKVSKMAGQGYSGLDVAGSEGATLSAQTTGGKNGGMMDPAALEAADSTDALDELIRVMKTLVKAIPQDGSDQSKQTFLDLQVELNDVFHSILSQQMEHLGCLDGIVDLLTTLVGRSSVVHIKTWGLVEALHGVVTGGAIEFFGQVLAPIDNMISVDGATFFSVAHPDTGEQVFLVRKVVSMIQYVYQEHNQMSDRLFSAAVMAVDLLLLAARTHGHANTELGAVLVNELLPPLLKILGERLAAGGGDGGGGNQSLKILVANCFLAGMVLHMEATLKVLHGNNALEGLMQTYSMTVRGSKTVSIQPAPLIGKKGKRIRQPAVEEEVPFVELRMYDRSLFLLAVSNLLRNIRTTGGGVSSSLIPSLSAGAVEEWILDAKRFAEKNLRELKTRHTMWEEREAKKAKQNGGNNKDDDDDDGWENESDGSTDFDDSEDGDDSEDLFGDEDGDEGDDDELWGDGGDDEAENDDSANPNAVQGHLQRLAQMARQHAEDDIDDDNHGDLNLLDETDFESAIDSENVAALLIEELTHLPAELSNRSSVAQQVLNQEVSAMLTAYSESIVVADKRKLL